MFVFDFLFNFFFRNEKSGPVYNPNLANSALQLAQQIDSALQKYSIFNGQYSYEIDGFGSFNMMDDANVKKKKYNKKNFIYLF